MLANRLPSSLAFWLTNGPRPVLLTPGAGARCSFTMFTQHVDAACSALTSRGVTLINGPADQSCGIRNACFADPSGQIWEIAGPPVEAGQEPATDPALFDTEKRNIGNIVLFAADVRAVESFYAEVFALPVAREFPDGAAFELANLTLMLLDHVGAKDLIRPAEVAADDAGVRLSFCSFTAHAGTLGAALPGRGTAPFRPVTDYSFGHRIAAFRDPAGHIWKFAADIPAAGAQQPAYGSEKDLLVAKLDAQREHILGVLEGLTDEQLRQRVLPTGWSCLGLVQHLTQEVELLWVH